MSMRLVPQNEKPFQHPPAGAQAQTPAEPLRNSAVACVGPLATMTTDEFVEIVTQHGGQYAQSPKTARIIVVGEGDWPMHEGRQIENKLKTLEQLEKQAKGGVRIVSEEQFLDELGLQQHRENLRQLFSTARLTEILEVSRETLRAWVRAGLIKPARTELGVWYFDFREVSAARMLVDLTGAGITIDRIRKSLTKLRKWMPQLEQPLQQLAVLEKAGPVLVRLREGDLSEPEGQLHFEFGSSPDAFSQPAATATPLRIAPGPRTAEQWLEQGLAQEREGYLDEAAASYRQALLVGGPHAQTNFNLANVLRALGHKSQALERYSQAVEVDPDLAEAWNNLGTLLAELGRGDDACAAFRRALSADPDDARPHYNLADLLEEMDRAADAAPHWKAYIRYDPASQWGQYARRRLQDQAS